MPERADNNPGGVKVLHFADAHIDIANYGRHDKETGLPLRVVDFLNALDQIVAAAISECVDLVLFAGDAYKDRNPQPTFQREWGKRIMQLSQAGIPTVLLVGNHDVSPATGRAHTLQEFTTLGVPHIHIADRLTLLTPEELGVPLQIVTLPWISRSAMMRGGQLVHKSSDDIMTAIEERVTDGITLLMDQADPDLPLVLLAHASVQGAAYGSERAVMLGQELVLGGALVRDKRWDYVALGHIHKHQSLNSDFQPPVVYPGSIERIDFGEARETKGYVLTQINKTETTWHFVPLQTRQFIDVSIEDLDAESFMSDVMRQLPPQDRVQDAICRVRLRYPRDWEPLLDEAAIYAYFEGALSLQIQKHRTIDKRARLGDTAGVESLSPDELLTTYWQSINLDETEVAAMQKLAQTVFADLAETD